MAYTNGMMFPVTALEAHRHPTLDTPVKRGQVYDAGDRITAEHMRGLSLVLLGDHEATVLPHPEDPIPEWHRNEPQVLQALIGFKFEIKETDLEPLTDDEIKTVEAFIHDQHAWEGGADTNPPAPPASIHAFSPQGIAEAAEKAEQDRLAAEAKAKEDAEAEAKAKEDAAKAEAAEAEKKAQADAEAAKAAAATKAAENAAQAPAASKPAAKRTRTK